MRMGRPKIGSREVSEVIHRLGLRKTIASLPLGLETRLCISGYPLSQGEAIRLMLVRALIAKPGVILIDGLLDRLSDEATLEVLESLKSFKNDSTIIISTGRAAIKRWADKALDIGQPAWRMEKYDG